MMKTKTKKVNLINRRGKITGSVVVKETVLKPCMNMLDEDFDLFFVKPRFKIIFKTVKKRKKVKNTKNVL